MSSGEPEVGLYVHWNRVTCHLAEINRFRNVVVHAFAYSDSTWYREQLQKIAEVTGAGRETVKSRRRYALRRLRAGLEDCDD